MDAHCSRCEGMSRRSISFALTAASISLAFCVAGVSCVLRTDEKVVAISVPLQVRALCPAQGSTSGGDPLTLWIASTEYDGNLGLQVLVGGIPIVPTAALGPVNGCLWAVSITAPPLPRGRHDVRVVLPGVAQDESSQAYNAVPASLSLLATSVYGSALQPRRLASGDFDGDGAPDLAVAHGALGHQSEIVLLRNDGSSSCAVSESLDTGGTTVCIAAGALNQDGRDDLLSVRWEGTGMSTVRPFVSSAALHLPGTDLPAATDPTCLAFADIDGDGDQDALLGSGAGAAVQVILNDGSGAVLGGAVHSVGTHVGTLAAGLFDTDSSADLAVCDGSAASIWLLRSHGDGSFDTPFFAVPVSGPVSVTSGDLDGDGSQDLVAASSTGLSLEIALNDGNAFFLIQAPILLTSIPTMVKILDFDTDGNADIVAIHGNELTIWCGAGNGGILPGRSVHLTFTTPLSDLEISDANLDGFLDIHVIEPAQNVVWTCLNTSS